MRSDAFIRDVLERCDALKTAGFWPPEPKIRPRAWLDNFDDNDRHLAALLLENFHFYSDTLTDFLLKAAFDNLGDGLPKGPCAPNRDEILSNLPSAVFTPIEGESPSPTDSGNLFCRKARQILLLAEERIVTPAQALVHASNGGAVVFLDDFIGSGDQFLKTWKRPHPSAGNISFESIHRLKTYTAVYVSLVATKYGLSRIFKYSPTVAVSAAHIIDEDSTIRRLQTTRPGVGDELQSRLEQFLRKVSLRLRPREEYIARNPEFLAFGYHNRGLLLAFAHSVPDATLPVFWSPGDAIWTPLIQRA